MLKLWEENNVKLPPEDELEKLTLEEIGLVYATVDEHIEVDEDDASVHAIVPAVKIRKCPINRFLLCWDSIVGKWILFKVTGMIHLERMRSRFHYQFDKELVESSFSHRVGCGVYDYVNNSILVKLKPIVCFTVKSLGKNVQVVFEDVSFAPHRDAPIYLPNPCILDRLLGLPSERDGVVIGILMEGNNPVIYKVNGSEVAVVYRQKYSTIFEHEVVSGTSGAGKTVYLKNKVKNLIDVGFAVITTEAEGSYEWSECVEAADPSKMEFSRSDLYFWKLLGYEPSPIYDVKILVLNENYSIKWSDIELEYIPLYFPLLTGKAQPFFVMAVEKFREASRKHGFQDTFDNFYNWIHRDDVLNWLLNVKKVHKAQIDNIVRTVEAIKSLAYNGYGVFDAPYPPISPDEVLKPGRLTILKIPENPLIKRIVLMHFMRLLCSWKLVDSKYDEIPTIVVIDEAHDVIRKPDSSDKAYSDWQIYVNYKVTKMVREGRHKLLGFIFSSQFPTDIDGQIYGNCSTKTFFRTCEERVLRALPDLGLPSSYKEKLKVLPNGECYIYAPDNVEHGVREVIHRVKNVLPKVMHRPVSSNERVKKILEKIRVKSTLL